MPSVSRVRSAVQPCAWMQFSFDLCRSCSQKWMFPQLWERAWPISAGRLCVLHGGSNTESLWSPCRISMSTKSVYKESCFCHAPKHSRQQGAWGQRTAAGSRDGQDRPINTSAVPGKMYSFPKLIQQLDQPFRRLPIATMPLVQTIQRDNKVFLVMQRHKYILKLKQKWFPPLVVCRGTICEHIT